MSRMVYLNGSIMTPDQASISVQDYGFLYGCALFETMRAYDGKIFRLDSHLARLAKSATLLGIQLDLSMLRSAVYDLLQANELREAKIRITLSAGEGAFVPDLDSCKNPNIFIVASEYQPYPDDIYQRGFKVIVSSWQRNSGSLLSHIKSTNYLENLLARQEARKKGADEAIWLNEKGLVAEGTMSNVFLVFEDVIKTPPEESGILPGITRRTIFEIAESINVKIIEDKIDIETLKNATEIFITNSLIEVMPVTTIENVPVNDGTPGPKTRLLQQKYREVIHKELQLAP